MYTFFVLENKEKEDFVKNLLIIVNRKKRYLENDEMCDYIYIVDVKLYAIREL